MVSTVVTALLLAVPVVSGAGIPSMTFDSSSSSSSASRESEAEADSPVVMGRDGRAVTSSTFAGRSASADTDSPASASASADGSQSAASSEEPGVAAPESTAPAPGSASAKAAPPAADTSTSAPAGALGAETPTAGSVPPAPTSAGSAAPAAPAVPAGGGAEEQVLAMVNTERAAAGCGALVADAGLAGVARAHSEDMRDRGFFSHDNPDGLGPFERAELAGLSASAENIAVGQQDAAEVMADWMSSPGHRENILDCELGRLGVGVATGSGGPWWTQLFG
jgi:uncharacterized protein YkwD